MTLTRDEELRYSRHLILPEVGLRGQERLKAARVLLVGAGGLGSPAALYLTAAGIGELGIVDSDAVEISNLQRQILHGDDTLGQRKTDSAAKTLARVNPHVRVTPIDTRLTAENALEIIEGYDIVIDATDNFPTRYLLNDACALLGKPLVFGSIFRFEGQVTVFDVRRGPCYRCLFPDPPPPESVPTCAEGGVLGVLPGIVGAMQAAEAIKLVLGIGEPLIGRLLFLNALAMTTREWKVEKNPECPLCGDSPAITELMDYQEFCGIVDATPNAEWEISADELSVLSSPRLIDVREEWELEDMPGHSSAENIPFSLFRSRMGELDSAADIILYCSTGARSWQLTGLLRRAGFTRAWSLRGGLLGLRREETRCISDDK